MEEDKVRFLLRKVAEISRAIHKGDFQKAGIVCEEAVSHINYGYLLSPLPRMEMLYFRDGDERHLRRDVIDNFLRGKKVDQKELRDAVTYLCCHLSELSDSLFRQAKRIEEQERHRRHFQTPRPPRNPMRRITG